MLYSQMQSALLEGVGAPGRTQLLRVDVDFSMRSKQFSLSKLVGRTAHIEFIENQCCARFLVWGVILRYRILVPEPHAWL